MRVDPRPDWRAFGVALLIATALQAWSILERSAMGAVAPLSAEAVRVGLHLAMVGCVVVATLLADRASDRGRRPLVAHGGALLAGSAAAAGLEFAVLRWAPWPAALGGAPLGAANPAQAVKVFLDFLLWGATFVWAYAALREKWRAAARMKAVQLEHTRIRQRAMQAQLQALQARVEPGFLFGTLEQVRLRYAEDPLRGGALLDALVAYLRAALPQLRHPESTLGKELDLARSYLAIRGSAQAAPAGAACKVEVDDRALQEPMAPMLLLPLLAGLCAGDAPAGAVPELVVSEDAVGLRISVTGAAPAGTLQALQALLGDLRQRLAATHGERATLELEQADAQATRVVLRLPRAAPRGRADEAP